MKTLDTMSKDERGLLLYLESRAVDNNGRVDVKRMNESDMDIAKQWNKEGFCQFGRIACEDVNANGSHWCSLSNEAWALVAEERKARAIRCWGKRIWKTTAEKREEKTCIVE